MKKISLILLLSVISCSIFSQKKAKDFEILLPQKKIHNSLYNSFEFLDSRIDTTSCGIVQVGAFNKKVWIKPTSPLSIQLNNIFNSLISSSANKGNLLFQLRQLSFAELTVAMSEKGYFYLRAGIYSKDQNLYRKISFIDTVVLIKSIDVTKPLFREGSKVIADFMANSLLMEASDSRTYSLDDIIKIDSVEKREILVYNTDKYADGLYFTYESFKNQVPERQIKVKLKEDGRIANVKKIEEKASIKINPENYFCIVYNGKPYVTNKYGYYRMYMKDNDFYFSGRDQVTAKAGSVITASLFFGVVGGIIASNANATFYMKLDHLNGGFIHLKEIKTRR